MSRRKQPSLAPIILAIGGILLIVAAALMVNANNAAAPTPPSHEEETYPDIPRVTIEETKSAMDSGAALIVDVRSAEAYMGGHIAGAINIPLAELESRLGELDPNRWIITYCT